ncbi:diaminobutyrate acetyltransferase [Methylomarinum sp. Ch1-1]|uniref:L-2,4-diaminobutyric acid acetyltransferase n=1 Tax=Methylomarinum roseum TaxID=3067653 RepID=A0AAU7NY03_9GAMM|nr:diaminobutyrate acetyltransferase [Methylomarinum sp. Ch1-1]MDP4522028.1 diaminobutyrate acetyltransferase [Methylomarinum sp. Ch1-1]
MSESETKQLTIELRPPLPEDGASVFKLVERCPPLDINSMYCNLLQSSHFAATSVAALLDGELVGFISGYLIPERPDTLFIWQVAVAEQARGQGLASSMAQNILARPQCRNVTHIETTITEANQASWALFQGLANKLQTELQSSVMFDRGKHFDHAHDTEMLVKLGPLR